MLDRLKEIPMTTDEWIVAGVMFFGLVAVLIGLYILGTKWEEENEEKEGDEDEDIWNCEADSRPNREI